MDAAARSDEQLACSLCWQNDGNVETEADGFMVACDACEQWFHGRCVGLDEIEVADIEEFHCPTCRRVRGPSVARAKANDNRYDWSDVDGSVKPLQSGSQQFVEQLTTRQFPECGADVVVMDNGLDFGLSYFEKNPFDRPVLFKSAEHLGLDLPPPDLTLKEVGVLVGTTKMVDVIDVSRQRTFRMELRKFLGHFEEQKRTRILNLVSLEVSRTGLGEMIKEPEVVRQISWADQYWPQDQPNDHGDGTHPTPPEVSKFCLISMAGSYTDFHIDFSGTSVWYAPVQGSKVFYLIKPTEENLRIFEEWMRNADNSEQFFGDLVTRCSTLTVSPGNVVLIPTGWIHAVLSPADSLVYGGNFLHSYNIELQLKIFDMERRLDMPDKFIFPNYIILHWHVAHRLLEQLNDYNDDEKALPSYLFNGMQVLTKQLKAWQIKSKVDTTFAVPDDLTFDGLSCAELLKKLNKALSTNEAPVKGAKSEKKKVRLRCAASPYSGRLQMASAPRKSAKERDINLKVKIKLDNSSSWKRKASGAESSDSAVPEGKETKKRRRTNALASGRKIVPYYDSGLSMCCSASLNPRRLFDPKFDEGERPIVGYSIRKLYCYPATGSLLMSVEGGDLGEPKSTTYKETEDKSVKKCIATDTATSRSGRTLVRSAKLRNHLVNNWAFSDLSEKDTKDAEYIDQEASPSPPESPATSTTNSPKKGVFPFGQNERQKAAAKQKGKTQAGKPETGASPHRPQYSKYKTTRERLVRKLKIDTKRMH